MNKHRQAAAEILQQHLDAYRQLPHSELAARLGSRVESNLPDVQHGVLPDGSQYAIETNIGWDDFAKGHIRVMADISTNGRGCLLGILPIFSPDATGTFILAPDGTFIDE